MGVRSQAVRAASAAGLVMVLSLAMTSAAAWARTTHAGPETAVHGLNWHPLHLIMGWHSAQGRYGTGDPAWAVQGGVVYLSGSLYRSGGTSEEFAVLPRAERPAHYTYLPVYTLSGTTGNLLISPAGVMSSISVPEINAADYTSLAALSYLPAGTRLGHRLSLKNGWTSLLGIAGSANPSVTVRNGVVYLSGALHNGSHPLFAVLPPADWPARTMWLSIDSFSGTTGELEIFSSGQMFALLGNTLHLTSLSGASFRLGSAGTRKLTLLNGWRSTSHRFNTGDPAYSVARGVVYLSGGLRQPVADSKKFAMLPPAARPGQVLYIQVYNAGGIAGVLRIEPSGAIEAYNGPQPAAAQALTSLAGVSYSQHG